MSRPTDAAAATVGNYAAAVGALRVVALLDSGDDHAAVMIEWTPATVVVTEAGEEREVEPVGERAQALPELRAVPPSSVTVLAAEAEIRAPVGAVAHMAEGVRALAAALGGRSVAAVDFATAERDVVLTLAAREGEPVLAAVGDEQFQLPDA